MTSRHPVRIGILLAVLLVGISLVSLGLGPSASIGLGDVLHAGLAKLGLAKPANGAVQVISELRLYRLLVSIGVGAALALSGALLQGVFRNQLASPSIIGVTSGASLGASMMILFLSSSSSFFLVGNAAGMGPLLVTIAAFVGAALSTLIVTAFATTGGRISVPTLLLVGIALNAIVGGAIATIQRFAVEEADLMRALVTWTFGRLDDRAGYQVVTIWVGLATALLVIPRVAIELDLFAAGEDDAHTLGVDTARVKWLALGCAALCAALAVSVAGQIGFIGLIAPHVLRRLVGSSNRHVLWLSLLAGPVLLCGADLAQRLFFGHAPLPPGVIMSLIGGPFFLVLLLKNKSSVEGW
jgi:iron complex transport system permease protein